MSDSILNSSLEIEEEPYVSVLFGLSEEETSESGTVCTVGWGDDGTCSLTSDDDISMSNGLFIGGGASDRAS